MTVTRSNVEKAFKAKRPVLHRLSEGTCWLVSLPYPNDVERPEGRHWYHILLDTWIWGDSTMMGGWMFGQRFKDPAPYASIEDVQALCRDIEDASHAANGETIMRKSVGIDAVCITHSNADHFVPHVILTIPPEIPCLASTIAYESVRKLKHFDTIHQFGSYDPSDWKADSVEGIPTWFNVGLLNPPADLQHQTPAVIISFETDDKPCAIIYALHGIEPLELEPMVEQNKVDILAYMAGMTATRFVVGPRVTLGATRTVACLRLLKPRYYIRNHDDEFIENYGLIGMMLRMDVYDLDRALREEAEAEGGEVKPLEGIQMADLRAGQSVALV